MADHNGLTSQNDLDELPPPVTHSSNSLSRQPTRNNTSSSCQSPGEDQSSALLALKASLDTLERSLSAKSEDPNIQTLKSDYSDFKSRPSLNFFHDVVSVSTFHLPSTRTVCYPPAEDEASGETFSDCIEGLTLALREGADTECVRTWYESAEYRVALHTNAYPSFVSMDSRASKLYPFRKMFLTTAKSHQRKQEAPIKAILHLIGQKWSLSPVVMESWVGMTAPRQGFPRIKRPSVCEFRWRMLSIIQSTNQGVFSRGAAYARLCQ